jgi:hypothetical protein
MYLRIINNEITYPYSLQTLREENPRSSFPSEMTESVMNEFNIYEVRQTPKPNDYTKNIFEETPILVEGVYYQNWQMEDASSSEIDERLISKWVEVRQIRNELLGECDWTQLTDIPAETKNLWQNYRQELRDITNQSNPFNIIWPVRP